MGDFLRLVGAFGLPLTSFGLGFLVTAKVLIADKPRLSGLGLPIVAVMLCGIQLISEPVIEPIWLQYLLLFLLPMVGGFTLLARPQRKSESSEAKKQD